MTFWPIWEHELTWIDSVRVGYIVINLGNDSQLLVWNRQYHEIKINLYIWDILLRCHAGSWLRNTFKEALGTCLQENVTIKNNFEHKSYNYTTLNENYLKDIKLVFLSLWNSSTFVRPTKSFCYRNGQRNRLRFLIYLHFVFLYSIGHYIQFSVYTHVL